MKAAGYIKYDDLADIPRPSDEMTNNRREVFGWVMYDWASSAFSTTVVTVLAGPYLTALAQSVVGENGTALRVGPLAISAKSFFPYCISLSVFLQVFVLPLAGAIAEYIRLQGAEPQNDDRFQVSYPPVCDGPSWS